MQVTSISLSLSVSVSMWCGGRVVVVCCGVSVVLCCVVLCCGVVWCHVVLCCVVLYCVLWCGVCEVWCVVCGVWCVVCDTLKNPCVHSTRHRVYVQYVPVCTGTTRTHVSTCARGAGIHGDVLNVHTERVEWTHGVRRRRREGSSSASFFHL